MSSVCESKALGLVVLVAPSGVDPLTAVALGGSVPTPKAGVTAEVVELTSLDELAKLGQEKLAGKIVFFGEMREVKPVDKPLFERRDEANLKQTVEYPVHVGEREDFFADFIKKLEFREKAGEWRITRAHRYALWLAEVKARSAAIRAAFGAIEPVVGPFL